MSLDVGTKLSTRKDVLKIRIKLMSTVVTQNSKSRHIGCSNFYFSFHFKASVMGATNIGALRYFICHSIHNSRGSYEGKHLFPKQVSNTKSSSQNYLIVYLPSQNQKQEQLMFPRIRWSFYCIFFTEISSCNSLTRKLQCPRLYPWGVAFCASIWL